MSVYDHIQIDPLLEAFTCLNGKKEFAAFLEDLLTAKEIGDIAQRLEVAKRLSKQEKYARIAEETGVSTATISRVNRSLVYGSGGYRLVLKRLAEQEQPQC